MQKELNEIPDVGSDAWMLEQGFRPLTPEESRINAAQRAYECADHLLAALRALLTNKDRPRTDFDEETRSR